MKVVARSFLPLVLAGVVLAGTAARASDPARFEDAVSLFSEGRAAEAQKVFEALLAEEPRSAEANFYLGRLAFQRDDHVKAVSYLERAVALAPGDSRMHHRLGDAYGRSAQKAGLLSRLGFAGKCRRQYEKAVELDPRNIDARVALATYYSLAPGIAGGDKGKAHAQAQEVKKLDSARGRLLFASIFAAEGKYDLAFAEVDEVLKAQPGDYAALFQSGRLAAISGQRLDRGLEALRACLGKTPPAEQPGPAAVHWRLGNILEKKGDKAGARAAYEASLASDPGFTPARESLKKL